MKKKISKYQAYRRIRNREISAIKTEKIKKVLMTLSNHLFLCRDTLNFFANEKIGLSFLREARDLGLIIETQNQKQMLKKDEFFFEIGENGLYILSLDQIDHKKLPALNDRVVKEKILNFNRFLMNRDEKIEYEIIDKDYNIFRFEQRVYYYEEKDENEVIDNFKKEILKNKGDNQSLSDYFYENYNLIKIQKNNIKIYGQTKQTY